MNLLGISPFEILYHIQDYSSAPSTPISGWSETPRGSPILMEEEEPVKNMEINYQTLGKE